MDETTITELLRVADTHAPYVAADLEDAERFVRETSGAARVVIPLLAIGREHRDRVAGLVLQGREKGVLVQYDEASFLETTADREARVLRMFGVKNVAGGGAAKPD